MTSDIDISVIIPAYNEASQIEAALDSIAAYFKTKIFSYEVIVIDDGSKDQTFEAAQRCKSLFLNLRILKNDENRGKGYSVKRGMLEARGVRGLFMDADNSVTIDNLDIFLAEMERGADVVIGSIELHGAIHKDNNPSYRRILGQLSKVLIRTIATPGIHDTQRGFKLFSRKAMEIIFSRQTIDGWGFDIELIVIAQAHDLRIKELPVRWFNQPTRSLGIFAYPRTFVELVKIKFNLFKGKYR